VPLYRLTDLPNHSHQLAAASLTVLALGELCTCGGSLSVVTLGPEYCHFALQLGMSQYTPISDMTPLNTPVLHRLV